MNGNVGEGYVVSQARERLLRLLSELFQLDRVDLDFGIYRIMNAKRDEVLRFLENDLLPEIGKALGTYENTERAALEAELETKLRPFLDAALDEGMIDNIPAIRELREKLAALANPEDLETEIFDALYTFFSRYYKDGDFLSLRRYKPGVYAIPYEGEEVKLHWANADQYYVKSTEDFQDYRFRLPDERHVHFRLVAAQTDRDNNKPAGGEERRFALRAENPVEAAGNDLNIYFEYKAGAEKQTKLNEETVRRIMEDLDILAWLPLLCAPSPTPSNKDRTLLEKHLADYTTKNSFDYFIHKDLGGFLRRELDFYLKNEILRIEDLDTADNGRSTHTLARIRAIKQVAGKLIDFLAQLEDFQKKLWLKKKFVVRTDYCITLDRVPEELYPDIAANDAQRDEWVRLFAIDEIKGDLTVAGYSAPVTVDFLRDNPDLVVDTRHFAPCFKDALIHSIQDLDDATSGLLVRSENFQALRLIALRHGRTVKCIYIDPPYNTGNDGFIYKDAYQHSSWLCMMADRLVLGRTLLRTDGVLFNSIDDRELLNLGKLLNNVFGDSNFLATFVRRRRMATGMRGEPLSPDHEYVLAHARSRPDALLFGSQRNELGYPYEDAIGRYASTDLTVGMTRDMRPNQFFPIRNPQSGVEYWPAENRVWRFQPSTMETYIAEGNIIWPDEHPDRNMSRPRFKTRYDPSDVAKTNPVSTWIDTRASDSLGDESEGMVAGMNQAGTKELSDLFDTQVLEYPKPVSLIQAIVRLATSDRDMILDHFAGSGTTGHAVIAQNREDGGHRKYTLVEMGEHFDTVLKPRIQKVIYSKDWKDGKPISRKGSSHMFKYMTLESYEDTLNNLRLDRPTALQRALDESPSTRVEYILHYMLDIDTRGSESLLDVDRFEDPFNYHLRITQGGETRDTTVDLVETFNWLLGLLVHKLRSVDGYRTVEGTDPDGRRVLVMWRVLKDGRHTDEDLQRFFMEQGYASRPEEATLDRIYVNGDCTLANVRRPQDHWDVLLTEAEFGRLMFAGADGAL